MKRRQFFVLTAGSTAGSLLLPRQSLARGGILGAPPPTDVPGYFCCYNMSLKQRGKDSISML